MRHKLLFEARDFMEANMSEEAPERIWIWNPDLKTLQECKDTAHANISLIRHKVTNRPQYDPDAYESTEYLQASIAKAQLATAEKSVELMHQACSKASSEYLQLRRKFLAAEKREAIIIKELEKLKKKCLDAGIEI